MCFGGQQKIPTPPPPPQAPPPPAPVQKVEPTKPATATPAPKQAREESPILKKKGVSTKKRERLRTGTATLQTSPGQGLNIGGGS